MIWHTINLARPQARMEFRPKAENVTMVCIGKHADGYRIINFES